MEEGIFFLELVFEYFKTLNFLFNKILFKQYQSMILLQQEMI